MSIMYWNPLIWSGLNNFIETMMFGGRHLLWSIEEAMLNVTNVSGQVVQLTDHRNLWNLWKGWVRVAKLLVRAENIFPCLKEKGVSPSDPMHGLKRL